MSKTFKKNSRMEDVDNYGRYYRFERSRQQERSFKDIDKYLKSHDLSVFEEDEDDLNEPRTTNAK